MYSSSSEALWQKLQYLYHPKRIFIRAYNLDPSISSDDAANAKHQLRFEFSGSIERHLELE